MGDAPLANHPDQAERERIRSDLDTTLLVEAAAGTGKTEGMVQRMVALLAGGRCDIGELAAVTFTRKAAAELRSRFQVGLEKAVADAAGEERERLAASLDGIDRCFAGTIHSFCARLLRERPVEAGVDVGFAEIGEEDDKPLRDRAWREYLLGAVGDPDVATLRGSGVEAASLRKAFNDFCDYPDIEEWPAPDVSIPDIAAPLRALRDYLAELETALREAPEDLPPDSLPGLCRSAIRLAARAGGWDHARLLDVFRLLQTAHGRKTWEAEWQGKAKTARPAKQALERFNDGVGTPFIEALLASRYAAALRIFGRAKTLYDGLRASGGVLNYQDLLMKAAALLRQPEVRSYFQARWRRILVDEFQDTDPIQAEVLLLLASSDLGQEDWRACVPRPGSLFVVGDPKQSIYRFRRADIAVYDAVKGIIKGHGAVIPLWATMRSAPAVVEWVNGCFAGGWVEAEGVQPAYVRLEAVREEPAAPLAGVARLTMPQELTRIDEIVPVEAARVAATIAGTCRPPGDYLVISAKRDRLVAYGAALERFGIPHEITGGTALNESRTLHLLKLALAAASAPEDPVALVAALRSDLFGISDDVLYRFARGGGRFSWRWVPPQGMDLKRHAEILDAFGLLRRCAALLAMLPPAPAAWRAAGLLGLLPLALAGGEGNLQGGSLCKGMELLRGAEEGIVESLGALLAVSEGFEKTDGMPARSLPPNRVRVMNLHKAKGLEAPVVFLVEPSRGGHFPITLHVRRAGTISQGYLRVMADGAEIARPPEWGRWEAEEKRMVEAEKKRLLYVAATRSRDGMVVTHRVDKEANKSGSPWREFTAGIADEVAVPPAGAPAAELVGAPVAPADAEARLAEVNRRRATLAEPTYRVESARGLALDGSHGPAGTSGETDGQQRGRAIHALLEAALRHPGADLGRLAASVIAEGEFPDVDAAEVVTIARSVAGSEIWRRARAASSCLTEVPFTRFLPPDDPDARGLPTLLRGVVDLAFLEEGGWVIVDWKSNPIGEAEVEEVAEHYAPQIRLYRREWEQITGEPVKEVGLFFTHPGRYRAL